VVAGRGELDQGGCALVTADLERGWEGKHELTAADVRAYADAKVLTDAQRAGTHKAPDADPACRLKRNRSSPWCNFGI
jgi:hypothetical protein